MTTHTTADEAIAALREAAFTTGEGRTIIHTFSGVLGSVGSDWDLEGAEEFVRDADEVAWVDNLFEHNLGARCGSRVIFFDVKRPSQETS